MTPEGQVKKRIKETLQQYGIVSAAKIGSDEAKVAVGWYFMPKPFGVISILDFVGHYRGRFFSIEAKAEGKAPTELQALQRDTINWTGGAAFVIDGEHSLNTFKRWVEGR